jgi:hypothetical protein
MKYVHQTDPVYSLKTKHTLKELIVHVPRNSLTPVFFTREKKRND